MEVPALDVPDTTDYARELRRWRMRRGLSMKALANLMAYDRSYVSHIEGCTMYPTADFTRRAEEALNAEGALWSQWEALAAVRGDADTPSAATLGRELRTTEFVAWLADHASSGFRETYQAVAVAADRLDAATPAVQHARDYDRGRVSREQVSTAIAGYYGNPTDHERRRLYRARVGSEHLTLSVLTEPAWLGTGVQLGTTEESARFQPALARSPVRLGEPARLAAIARLAELETAGTVLMNNPLYRLASIDLGPRRLVATIGLADFASYALTSDLLETELVDAISTSVGDVGPTPLRDQYLPSLTAATALDQRECVGGPATLVAIARPGRGSRPADYVVLIQERSRRVLNVAGRLAVIPKAFHQPISEPAAEAGLLFTVERELEEELFGRRDLEQLAHESHRLADPMHDGHRSEPMAWLADHRGNGYRTECVSFGINLVTGNYEFACLVVVNDDDWWQRFGHLVEANWEASRIHRYSTRDTDGLAALALDPRWSNEGLFAFLEGLRRLAQLDTSDRVAAVQIDVED